MVSSSAVLFLSALLDQWSCVWLTPSIAYNLAGPKVATAAILIAAFLCYAAYEALLVVRRRRGLLLRAVRDGFAQAPGRRGTDDGTTTTSLIAPAHLRGDVTLSHKAAREDDAEMSMAWCAEDLHVTKKPWPQGISMIYEGDGAFTDPIKTVELCRFFTGHQWARVFALGSAVYGGTSMIKNLWKASGALRLATRVACTAPLAASIGAVSGLCDAAATVNELLIIALIIGLSLCVWLAQQRSDWAYGAIQTIYAGALLIVFVTLLAVPIASEKINQTAAAGGLRSPNATTPTVQPSTVGSDAATDASEASYLDLAAMLFDLLFLTMESHRGVLYIFQPTLVKSGQDARSRYTAGYVHWLRRRLNLISGLFFIGLAGFGYLSSVMVPTHNEGMITTHYVEHFYHPERLREFSGMAATGFAAVWRFACSTVAMLPAWCIMFRAAGSIAHTVALLDYAFGFKPFVPACGYPKNIFTPSAGMFVATFAACVVYRHDIPYLNHVNTVCGSICVFLFPPLLHIVSEQEVERLRIPAKLDRWFHCTKTVNIAALCGGAATLVFSAMLIWREMEARSL